MQIDYTLVMDFARPKKSYSILIAEGDQRSRVLKVVLMNNGKAMDLSDVQTATIKAVKPDEAIVFGDGTIETDGTGNPTNVVSYVLPADLSDVVGRTSVTVTLVSEAAERITTPEFYVIVGNQLYNENDYASESDLTGFQDLLNRALAAVKKAEQLAVALPCPYALSIVLGNTTYTYDGSAAVTVELTDGNHLSY